ncbi:MAG: cation-efflux pump, partial [Oscillospiraceae bacterium]|nr:cation-efflux pump [Oscillospiraceae bacterium]
PELVAGIQETVLAHSEILGVHDLVVHDYGPGHIMATLHAEVSIDADMGHTHDVIDNVERELHQKFRVLTTIHMDPIVTNDARVNALREEMLAIAQGLDERITLHDFRMTEGPTHINLIFDVVVPRDCPLSDEEVRKEMASRAKESDPKYITVVQVDHPYA